MEIATKEAQRVCTASSVVPYCITGHNMTRVNKEHRVLALKDFHRDGSRGRVQGVRTPPTLR